MICQICRLTRNCFLCRSTTKSLFCAHFIHFAQLTKLFVQLFLHIVRLTEYKPTSLESEYRYPLLTEADLGISLLLIEPDAYAAPPHSMSLLFALLNNIYIISNHRNAVGARGSRADRAGRKRKTVERFGRHWQRFQTDNIARHKTKSSSTLFVVDLCVF